MVDKKTEWNDYDTDLTPEDVIGTHVFEDVLYTGDSGVVNVITGETPTDLDRSVEQAKAFAESAGVSDTPHVAKSLGAEQQVEGRSPYSACAFYHFSIVGGMDWHMAFMAAYDLDGFDVEFDADYQTGDLTITVGRV